MLGHEQGQQFGGFYHQLSAVDYRGGAPGAVIAWMRGYGRIIDRLINERMTDCGVCSRGGTGRITRLSLR